jgi:hypothetical protein
MLPLLGIVGGDECCCSRSSRIFRDEPTMSTIAGVANAAPNVGIAHPAPNAGAGVAPNVGDAMAPHKLTYAARCCA